MKITLEPKSFAEAVGWATKSFNAKNPGAYVALVITKDKQGYLFHANDASFMKCPINVLDVSGAEKGVSFALDGAYLQRFASIVSGMNQSLELSHEEGDDSLRMTTSNGKFTLPTFDKKVGAEPKVVELGEVDDHEYFDSMQRVSKLCDSANSVDLPAMGAVDIDLRVDDKMLAMMGTDRYALAEVVIPFEPTDEATEYVEETGHVLLPVEAASGIAPTKGLSATVTFIHDPVSKKFGYRLGDDRIALFSLKEADRIPYQGMRDRERERTVHGVTVNTDELRKAIKTVSNLSYSETNIYFDITEDELVVHDSTSSNKLSIPVSSATLDDPISAQFLRTFIQEGLIPVTTAEVSLTWSTESNPFVIVPMADDGTKLEDVFVLVMPFHH